MQPNSPVTTNVERDDSGEHYVTAGITIATLGLLCLVVAIVLSVRDVPLHFIDSTSMAIASCGFIAQGGWMVQRGRRTR